MTRFLIHWAVSQYSICYTVREKPDRVYVVLSHILLQYVSFCMFNNSYKSVLVICLQGKYGANIICPYLTSGICAVVWKISLYTLLSKYKERWCIRSYFNKISCRIGISIQMSTSWVDFANISKVLVQIDIVWYIFETRLETTIFASRTKTTLLKIYFCNLSV
jgi:hypothetical protein